MGEKNGGEKIIALDFAYVLTRLFDETKNVEASFSSKMVALLDPNQPVIDRHVLSYIERRLPAPHRDAHARITETITLHTEMTREFKKFLKSETGIYLVARFKEEFPNAKNISTMKMLDFVLWQSGGKKKIDQR